SPRHRWGPMGMSLTDAGRRLGGLVRGSFRGIQVIKRGVSPRIVAAMVVGTKGSTRVTGATLRSRFGLYDTWAYYTSIVAKKAPAPANAPADQPPQRAAGDGTGGANAGAARMTRFRTIASIAGTVLPARAGEAVRIQRRSGARWLDVATARASRGGAYRAAITQPGEYRAVFRGDPGSTVTVR
ncbi:MAG: hypothetical protein QOF55_1477, partial [Thermoleophilaceae bacterium]|nr:hypothetical protein [Thermoleophilaceae bacterium]